VIRNSYVHFDRHVTILDLNYMLTFPYVGYRQRPNASRPSNREEIARTYRPS